MTRSTSIHIEPANIIDNLSLVKQLTPGCLITAMVKANAYGCGYQSILPAIHDQVDALGVACIDEAIVIRQLGYQNACILFQGVFSSRDYPLIDEHNFEIVIHSEQQLQQFLSYSFNNRIRCWLKVDTGMHRLGVSIDEVESAIERLGKCRHVARPIGIMSHYACSDTPEHPLNKVQQQRFQALYEMLGSDFHYSMSNSGAIITQSGNHYDMVRPGIMIYGGSPLYGKIASELGLKPTAYFYSQVMAIKAVATDETVGYGAIWRAKKPCTIALVAVGYGDGYPRHISEHAYVAIDDQFAPIVGRVSMDMLAIDITELNNIKIGNRVELWGEHVPIDLVASWAGTISYELLCQFQRRVQPS